MSEFPPSAPVKALDTDQHRLTSIDAELAELTKAEADAAVVAAEAEESGTLEASASEDDATPAIEAAPEDPFKVVLVDQSRDALDEARDLADARLDRELGEGGKIKRLLNGIWKGNIAKDYYRQKYISQEIDTIKQSGNALAGSVDATRRTRAIEATIDRFSSDYEELIHTDAGERREVQAEGSELDKGIKQLVRDYAEGRLNETTLREERTRFLNEYRKEHGADALGEGVATTDNLIAVAQAVMGAVEHGESLDTTISKLQVITGEARNGARTETRYNAVDSIIEKMSKTKVGSLVTPGTLATGVAVAGAITRMGSHSVVGAVTKTLLPGVAAGLWAGLRENKRVKDERAQHAREMALGGSFEEGDKRRVEMEATRYETLAANDLIQHLQEVGDETHLDDGGNEALQAALDALAAVQARVELSDSDNVDLISYSAKEAVGEERMKLDLARREVRLALEGRLTEEVRTDLNLDAEADVRELIAAQAQLARTLLVEGSEAQEGMAAKDEAFAKLKRRRVATAAAVGVASGVVGGLVVQEAVAAFDPTRFGLIDALRGEVPVTLEDGSVHQTVLEGLVRGDETTVHTEASTSYDAYDTAPNGSIEVSSDHSLVTNEDGTMDLKAANGTVSVEGLSVDDNGSLTPESLDKLEAAGMVVEDHSFDQDITTTTSEVVGTEQYIANHSAETTQVTRDFWYGNDTPGVYDENELRVYRGGSADAPGIIDGGYQYTVAGMSAEGSWQGGESVNWNEAAANGNLFVAVSGTFDSQGNPFMIPIGPDGAVNIPADSPAGQFFSNEGGSVSFNGAYMEIVQTADVDPDGTVHIRPLATLVGDSSVREITDTVTTVTTEHHAEYTITTNGYDTIQDNFTEMAPITPIASRRSMEAIRQPEAEPNPDQKIVDRLYYSGEVSDVERERIIREVSPRLRDNPDAELNMAEELEWYREELRRRKGDAYIQELDDFIENDPVMSTLSDETASIVNIPVGAAYEAENIYGTLSLYAQQNPEGVEKSVIFLNVNWLDTAKDDPVKAAAIEKTISEIERARKDLPQLAISVMQKEYSEATVTATGGVIGYVADDLVNATLLSAERRIRMGEMSGDHEMTMVRGDADAQGISRNQLRNFQKAAAENGSLDVVKGVTRFGVEDQARFPGYGIVSNFMSAFQLLGSQDNIVHTGGANFAVRMSTLAAIGGLGDMMLENEDGERVRDTGAGSDDVNIGRRITAARNIRGTRRQTGYAGSGYAAGGAAADASTKRIHVVTGATADTSADRLLAAHLAGENIQSVWNPEKKDGFAAGPGGYRSRTEDAAIIERAGKEDFNGPEVYSLIEQAMTWELRNASSKAGRRALAMLFGAVPGVYILSGGDVGDENVSFVLTDAGRTFIKNRVERETNGQFGSYGLRKKRQLYGITKPGAKRQPAGARAPLVSPLA